MFGHDNRRERLRRLDGKNVLLAEGRNSPHYEPCVVVQLFGRSLKLPHHARMRDKRLTPGT